MKKLVLMAVALLAVPGCWGFGGDDGGDDPCVPDCTDRCAGDDGCGGSCWDNCYFPETCGGAGSAERCGVTESTWVDPVTAKVWQNPASLVGFTYEQALMYCGTLEWAGREDWRLPTIGELRSLIRGCPDTEIGGICEVDDDCLEGTCGNCSGVSGCGEGEGPEDGCYWASGLIGICGEVIGRYPTYGFYWSRSERPDEDGFAWRVYFETGEISSYYKSTEYYVRCIAAQ